MTVTLGGGGGGFGASGAGALDVGAGFGFGLGLVVCALAGIAIARASDSTTVMGPERFIGFGTDACPRPARLENINVRSEPDYNRWGSRYLRRTADEVRPPLVAGDSSSYACLAPCVSARAMTHVLVAHVVFFGFGCSSSLTAT
jgi:hypothetical protein